MESSTYRVGDRVVICEDTELAHLWHPEMYKCIGKKGTVTSMQFKSFTVGVTYDNSTDEWYYPFSCLQGIESERFMVTLQLLERGGSVIKEIFMVGQIKQP